ncbi:class D sortase [Planococcus sp. FY231025]|uniref:class D sortase n=1 Tax=Planococcus sp. FY231025 TaxID=3455699 RepID=UPI003F901F2C
MKRKLGIMLILLGLFIAGWNGFVWLSEFSSGREPIGEHDIAEADGPEDLEGASKDVSPVAEETRPIKQHREASLLEEAAFLSKKDKKSEEPKQRDYKKYGRGEEVGWLLIPSLDRKYPIYWGSDDETLTQGVGYHTGQFTTPPDGQRHTVLAGHRDTVFRELEALKEGDQMYVQFEGVQYEYKISRTWITHAEDRTVIVAKDEPVLTLTTCYPFAFIGAAPDRYIIEAPLVDITEINS